MTNEDTFGTLLEISPTHPMTIGIYLLLAACVFNSGCNKRAVRLLEALSHLFKAFRE